MTAHEILIAAKQELLTRGWHQGGLLDPVTGAVCALGAMSCAVGALSLAGLRALEGFDRATFCLQNALGVEPVWGIGAWNDEPARTPEEVLQAFDRAIALAETREAVTA